MKLFFLTLLLAYCSISFSQNIDYESRITSFYAGNCGNDPGFSTTEEHTWNGWIRDNVDVTETYSGCITRDNNGAVTQTGTYANRTRNNTTATSLVARIDAWEDDSGNRCTYNTGTFVNNDDCRVQSIGTYVLANPLEYQPIIATSTLGSSDYNMNVYRSYQYSTVPLSNATEYTNTTFTTGGNRPFWGSRGSWGFSGSDCATSGTIAHNQTSSFQTTVSCESQVNFRWRVDSEANFDFLEVYVNGVLRNSISGNTAWASVTLNLNLGVNTIEWRYDKDSSISSGEDRGFVDDISFTYATVVNPGAVLGNQTVGCDGNPSTLGNSSVAQSYSNIINYQWQLSINNTTWTNIAGATGISYNPPAGITQTTYYRRRVQDGCGLTSYTNTITVTKIREYVYNGSWCPNNPAGPVNPSNSSDFIYVRSDLNQSDGFVTGDLTIDNGVTMTVSAAAGIQVDNQLNLNGTLDLGNDGQLIQDTGSILNMGTSGDLKVTRSGNPSNYRYTYWGSPVSNQGATSNSGFSISNVMNDATTGISRPLTFTAPNIDDGAPGTPTIAATISSKWLYAFRNQTNNYSNWEFVTPTTMLESGQGYTMKGTGITSAGQDYVFEGTPNNGDISLIVTGGNNYLVSNPYPSAIDSHSFLLDNPQLDGTIYFWEHYGGSNHLLSDYEGGYAMYNFSGGVAAPTIATPANGVSTSGTPTKLPARYIPVSQGFFVDAINTSPILFLNSHRVYATEVAGTSVFVKSVNTSVNNVNQVQSDTRTKLRLGLNSPNLEHRQILLTEDLNATAGVDRYYDGLLYDVFANDFGFDINDELYGIQGIPVIDVNTILPLIVNVNQVGDFEFKIDELENWPTGQQVFLYDNETSVYYDITNSSIILNLQSGSYKDRFSIRFQDATLHNENEILESDFVVYQPKNSHKIFIESNTVNNLDQILLFDMHGRIVLNRKANDLSNEPGRWTVPTLGLFTGSYILHLKRENKTISKKVIIK